MHFEPKCLYNIKYNKITGDVMKTLAIPRSVGGSIMITVPHQIVKALGIRPNEPLAVDFEKPMKSLFGASRGIGSFTREDELDARE